MMRDKIGLAMEIFTNRKFTRNLWIAGALSSNVTFALMLSLFGNDLIPAIIAADVAMYFGVLYFFEKVVPQLLTKYMLTEMTESLVDEETKEE